MDWPLIERELARRERSRRMYWLRFSVGGLAFVWLLLVALGSSVARIQPEQIADVLLFVGNGFQFCAALFLPLLLTPELIAREKQERTLGLLLLADHTGIGVYGSKFLSAFLPSALLIVGALPVLSLGAPFGGVDVGLLVVKMLLYLTGLLVVTAVGMLASIHARQPGSALFAAGFAVASLTVFGLWLESYLSSEMPAGMISLNPMLLAFASPPAPMASDWWVTCLIGVGTGTLLVFIGLRTLPNAANDTPIQTWDLSPASIARLRGRRPPGRRRDAGVELLSREVGGWSSAIRPWPLRWIAAWGLAAVAAFPCFGGLLLVGLIAHDVLSSLRGARNSGAVDDVRLAAEDPAMLARWIYETQAARCVFYVPAMIFGGGLGFGGTMLMSVYQDWMFVPIFTDSFLFLLAFALAVAASVVQVRLVVAISCYQFIRSVSGAPRTAVTVVWIYVGYLLMVLIALGILFAISLSLKSAVAGNTGWLPQLYLATSLAYVAVASGVALLSFSSRLVFDSFVLIYGSEYDRTR